MVRPLNVEPGHWKKQLPGKYRSLAQRGDMSGLAELLRQHPEYLNWRGSHGRTFLWEATRSGKLELARWLVDAGADVDATGCCNGESFVQLTPFGAARYYRRSAVAEYLGQRSSPPDIYRAAFLGDRAAVERELAARPDLLNADDPNDEIYYVPPLSFAIVGGHLDLAAFFIVRGADVASYSAQVIGLAAKAARRDLLDLLLANGADPRAVGSAIFVPVADLDLLAYLLSRGVSPHGITGDQFPPLVYVARGDKGEHPEKIQLLLDHGADVNAPGLRGRTALHYAASAGHTRVVQLLLAHGANPNLPDADGRTPFAKQQFSPSVSGEVAPDKLAQPA
jgi:hypothetical protein